MNLTKQEVHLLELEKLQEKYRLYTSHRDAVERWSESGDYQNHANKLQ